MTSNREKQTEQAELLPCPFCGAEAALGVVFDNAGVCCVMGCVEVTAPYEDEAIEEWNTRTPDLSQWQDIDSAPKDGKYILAWASGWECVLPVRWFESGDKGWWTLHALERHPTHWMPLPAAPNEQNVASLSRLESDEAVERVVDAINGTKNQRQIEKAKAAIKEMQKIMRSE